MDWAIAGLIGLLMFWIGDLFGYAHGLREGRDVERMSRRIDELTGTERL